MASSRSPFARLESYFGRDWQPGRNESFARWLRALLPTPSADFFDGDDLRHLRPIAEAVPNASDYHLFRLEDPVGSVAAVSRKLCDRYGYCRPLPPFPRGVKTPYVGRQIEWTADLRRLVEERYRADLAMLESA